MTRWFERFEESNTRESFVLCPRWTSGFAVGRRKRYEAKLTLAVKGKRGQALACGLGACLLLCYARGLCSGTKSRPDIRRFVLF